MKNKKTEKVIIIGGGVAGLSAGIYAQLAGFETEIYEKNVIPGGECIGWNRKGYHIDNCIHWLTGTKKGTELYDVWKTVGALDDDMEYAPINAFYTSTYNGQKVTLWNDLKRTEEELIALSPEDEKEIKKFIEYVEYSKQCLFPAKKPMEMWGVKDYIDMGKNMMDFPKVMKEFGSISLEEYSKRFKHPLLQHMMCDYLPKSYCTYSFLVSYATMADGNGSIPMGASLQMSLRMEKKYKDMGGRICYNTGVKKIQIVKKKATGIELEDGRFIAGDYVIPTVDTHLLFNKLISRKYMPKELREAYNAPKAFPSYAGNIEFLDAWTPLTYERYCNAYHGSYMSFVTTPTGKQIKMKGTLKGIKNLYVAGQWTNSPGGLPVAVASGKFAIQRILKKQRRSIEL